MVRAQLLKRGEPMRSRKAEVEQDEVQIRLPFDQFERATAIAGFEDCDIAVELAKHTAQRSAYQRVIVNDKYLHASCLSSQAYSGKEMPQPLESRRRVL